MYLNNAKKTFKDMSKRYENSAKIVGIGFVGIIVLVLILICL